MMVRTQRFRPDENMTAAWEACIARIAEPHVEALMNWPIYENAGEPWRNCQPMFVRRASLSQAVKIWMSGKSRTIFEQSDSVLNALYHNVTDVLTDRRQFQWKFWERRYQGRIEKHVKKAVVSLKTRLGDVADVNNSLVHRVNIVLRIAVWEELHTDLVPTPFMGRLLPVLENGHIPVGFSGTDWNTCEVLYF